SYSVPETESGSESRPSSLLPPMPNPRLDETQWRS
ncbi:hypothetical protein A2U01_0088813, partial [Trifolium medium]|nr:hypothetical protein [Trifolium medium]